MIGGIKCLRARQVIYKIDRCLHPHFFVYCPFNDCAIGNAHGFYKETPKLRLDRLKEIRAVTDRALVLHGSSGIPDDQLQEAIHCGISKINLATETKNCFMKKLQSLLADTDEIDLRKIFPKAINEVVKLITHKLNVVNFVSGE